MVQKLKFALLSYREFLFQLLLHMLVLVFYLVDSNHPHAAFQVEPYQFLFFINYTAANAIISYLYLPRFFYQKKYILFALFTLFTVFVVILIEEFVLEKIFLPDSRGASFPGVLFTLGQVLPIIAILSGFKFAWDALKKQRQVDELRAIIKDSELTFLKSQINPHFLFNNLNNLYAYAIENSPKTPTIILELSAVLRYMLYECREESVPLVKEIDHLHNFVKLYELQIEDRGEIRFNQPVQFPHLQIAPLILIVFIENAFKHSQEGLSDQICINIDINLSAEGQLKFICENNFQKSMAKNPAPGGIGLQNVKKRLELLYPQAHQLTILQQENCYRVQLLLQLNNDQ